MREKNTSNSLETVSFLRWAGSKRKLIPQLKEYWNDEFSRYIEPFMGSAQLFFSITPEYAVLGDTNHHLIETYEQIKKNPYPIYKILQTFKKSKKEYYKIRATNPLSLGVNQRVARFIYLNKLCFNGLYRTNANGNFNVPFSFENTFDPDLEYEKLKKASKKLKHTKIICGDFDRVVRQNVKRGDFVYLDPPYAVANRRIFKQYGPQMFGLEDLRRLENLLHFIDEKNATFLLSYAYCKESIELFNKWDMKKKFIQRNISGFSEYRRKAAEVLITNIK